MPMPHTGAVMSDLSRALDEIYALRLLLASEARILEAHLVHKTFPKSRRGVAEQSVARMRAAVRGDVKPHDPQSARRAYAAVYGAQTLTRYQWLAEKEQERD